MAKQQIRTQHLAEPVAHFSQAVSIEAKGKLVFISGMTARRPTAASRESAISN
jgi:enamine deaminase RidA (YjgF/YER057c/UK114 family)